LRALTNEARITVTGVGGTEDWVEPAPQPASTAVHDNKTAALTDRPVLNCIWRKLTPNRNDRPVTLCRPQRLLADRNKPTAGKVVAMDYFVGV
jgi:hypothetical protein